MLSRTDDGRPQRQPSDRRFHAFGLLSFLRLIVLSRKALTLYWPFVVRNRFFGPFVLETLRAGARAAGTDAEDVIAAIANPEAILKWEDRNPEQDRNQDQERKRHRHVIKNGVTCVFGVRIWVCSGMEMKIGPRPDKIIDRCKDERIHTGGLRANYV
ncbi:hypothetical protein EVAR_101455_1 [Eumeta japonica]|uniref:Uncharacterized protein n=1 Tax=Eumeta variegata TaxID=151549 RepID=A0A4C1SKW5_EUMVA|nr:hypothetical protein EVAR_101455_1 [Eumeta japonica]